MKLYLVQHGKARSEAEDPNRDLTVEGEKEVKVVAERAREMKLNPAWIYHSGKRRAEHTAEIIGKALDIPIGARSGLGPLDEVSLWAEKINQGQENLMLVGHLPHLEKLASYLIAGDEALRPLLFRNGSINCLEQKENRKWAVRWVLTPEMIPDTSL